MDKAAMNVKELAKELSVSLPTAYELVKRPEFPVVKIGKRILIPTKSLEQWLSKKSLIKNRNVKGDNNGSIN